MRKILYPLMNKTKLNIANTFDNIGYYTFPKKISLLELNLCIILIYSIIVPSHILPNPAIYIIVMYLFLIYFVLKNNSIPLKIILLGGMLTSLAIINPIKYNIFQVLFIMPILLISSLHKNEKKNEKFSIYLRFFFIISLTSIIFQLMYYHVDTIYGIRRTLSVMEPNFSGILILFVFMLSNKLKSFPGIIISIISAYLLESRNLILAILIFYIIKYSKRYINYKHILNPYFLFFFGTLAIYILSFYWIANMTSTIQYGVGIERTNLNDASNMGRFMANIDWINYLLVNISSLMFGIDNFEPFVENAGGLLPHNSLLYTLLSSGLIFGTVYFFIIFYLITKEFRLENFEYIAAFFFSSYFLHGLYSGYFIILFLSIFMIIERNRNTIRLAKQERIK